MLASFGLLGFLLYFTLFVTLLFAAFEKGWDKNKKIIFICFLGIAFLMSMTSRWYWSSFAYFNFLILPYLLATKKERL